MDLFLDGDLLGEMGHLILELGYLLLKELGVG
jgi:hypothetical protein